MVNSDIIIIVDVVAVVVVAAVDVAVVVFVAGFLIVIAIFILLYFQLSNSKTPSSITTIPACITISTTIIYCHTFFPLRC